MLDFFIKLMPSIVFVMYIIVGMAYMYKRDYAWALVWTSYAFANLGLVLIGSRNG